MSRVKGERSSILAPRIGTLASALAVAASLPPWDVPGTVFVALVPWLAVLRRAPGPGATVVQGFWLAFAAGLLTAPWMAVGLREFLQLPGWVAALGLVAFAALAAWPHWVVFALLFRWLVGGPETGRVPGLLALTGLALAWMGLEVLAPRPFEAGLGYALHDAPRLRQLADLGGVPLLGFGIALVNLALWRGFECWRRGPREGEGAVGRLAGAAGPLALAVVFLGGTWIYGELRLRALAAEGPVRTLRVAIVQGNVPNAVRLAWAGGDDRAAEEQLSAYTRLTEELIARERRPDWVVWPEASFPGAFGHALTRAERRRSTELDRQLLRLQRPIAFGAYELQGEQDGDEALRVHNGLFLVNPSYERPGSLGSVQRYRKHHLLPFAETLPFVEAETVRRWLPTVGFFTPGPGASVLRLVPPSGPAVLVTPIICSESLDGGYVAEGARKGSQLILNVGSDGWFGDSGEPRFHLAIARFRSIETRLPQVRAANTGISALVLPDGRVAARSSLGARELLDVEVPVPRAAQGGRSVFVRGGSSWAHAAGVLGIVLCGVLGASRGRGSSATGEAA